MSSFGSEYALAYDTLYRDKNYVAECDRILRELGTRESAGERILDAGCGTGGHAWELARRGYDMVGVDLSEPMLALARSKSAPGTGTQSPQFLHGDVRTLKLDLKFDAAIMMFAVLGYQRTNEDVIAALRSIRNHLEPGGTLVFDFWYGPAVLADRPGDRVRVVESGDAQILRATTASMDLATNSCTVSFRLWEFRDSQIRAHAAEEHVVRFFFEPEIRLLLELCGFQLARLADFSHPDRPASEETWNVLAVAEAV
ncbi:MAG: class I SAM-dependent methyltransferase [Candidatus Nanopelagicales bacterium]|nr:class I SAM-dependent methyltransferase [Candidatus Nanopelagicales bacterium]